MAGELSNHSIKVVLRLRQTEVLGALWGAHEGGGGDVQVKEETDERRELSVCVCANGRGYECE